MIKDKRLEIRINSDTKAKLILLAKQTTATGTLSELLDNLIDEVTKHIVIPRDNTVESQE